MDAWTDIIKDEHFLISTELKNYQERNGSSGPHEHEHGSDARGDESAYLNTEGPIPDALLHA